jgi:hypothetical protein
VPFGTWDESIMFDVLGVTTTLCVSDRSIISARCAKGNLSAIMSMLFGGITALERIYELQSSDFVPQEPGLDNKPPHEGARNKSR